MKTPFLLGGDAPRMVNMNGPAIRNANRSARIDSKKKKKPYFHNVRAIRSNRLKFANCNFHAPKCDLQKKGFTILTEIITKQFPKTNMFVICLWSFSSLF